MKCLTSFCVTFYQTFNTTLHFETHLGHFFVQVGVISVFHFIYHFCAPTPPFKLCCSVAGQCRRFPGFPMHKIIFLNAKKGVQCDFLNFQFLLPALDKILFSWNSFGIFIKIHIGIQLIQCRKYSFIAGHWRHLPNANSTENDHFSSSIDGQLFPQNAFQSESLNSVNLRQADPSPIPA